MRRTSPISCSASYTGGEPVAEARHLARRFLAEIQDVHRVPVSDRALDVVELVVSQLVTNTRKDAPGPSRLSLEVREGSMEVMVWDSNPTPPAILPPDPPRIGQQGLAIVMAVTHPFGVQHEPAGERITTSIALTDDRGGRPRAGRPTSRTPVRQTGLRASNIRPRTGPEHGRLRLDSFERDREQALASLPQVGSGSDSSPEALAATPYLSGPCRPVGPESEAQLAGRSRVQRSIQSLLLQALLPDHPADQARGCHVGAGDVTPGVVSRRACLRGGGSGCG
ncbi:ATP-binding protein [Streptomyces xanthophaeus]|uniref:ATP-binding protein n=1 Tax=Streptomyces xanthophaeus TaxID=67385 RepID=UPI00364C730C